MLLLDVMAGDVAPATACPVPDAETTGTGAVADAVAADAPGELLSLTVSRGAVGAADALIATAATDMDTLGGSAPDVALALGGAP